MHRKNKQRNPKKPLPVAIIILSAILFLNIITFFGLLIGQFDAYRPDESSILYTIKDNDFPWLPYQLGQYSAAEIAKNETLREAYAVNGYFESRFYYSAYAETDPDMAAVYQAAMAEHAANAGALACYITEIDAMFE